MHAKAQKPLKEGRPNPGPEKKMAFKYHRNPYSGPETESLVSGPRKKLLEFCRAIILEKRITTRTEFNRFAPKEVKKLIQQNPRLWDKIGLPNYHDEVRKNGIDAWKRHCESTLNMALQAK